MPTKNILQKLTPYGFLAPALIILGFALVYPVISGLNLSLFSWRLGTPWKTAVFRGFGNYVDLLESPFFYTSLRVTFIFTGTVVVAELGIGLALALLLEQKMRGLRIFRTLFVLPIMIAPVVVGVIWRLLYDPSFGLINYFLKLIAIAPRLWLAQPSLALTSIIITDIWQWTPFVFILILAGLQGLPHECIEAGVVDGASVIQTLRYIKLPLLKPIIGVTVLLRLIDAFRGLVVMFIMTFGGPGMSTQILSLHIYKTAFVSYRLGLACAIAVILLVIILLFSMVLLSIMRPATSRR